MAGDSAESDSGGKDWAPNDWASLGNGNVKSHVQRIEFIIRPGGMVEERVTGVKGQSCEKVGQLTISCLACVEGNMRMGN